MDDLDKPCESKDCSSCGLWEFCRKGVLDSIKERLNRIKPRYFGIVIMDISRDMLKNEKISDEAREALLDMYRIGKDYNDSLKKKKKPKE